MIAKPMAAYRLFRRPQVRLSTLLAVVVLFQVMVWANLRDREALSAPCGDFSILVRQYAQGWPWIVRVHGAQALVQPEEVAAAAALPRTRELASPGIRWGAVAANATCALGILAMAGIALEWRARRVRRGGGLS